MNSNKSHLVIFGTSIITLLAITGCNTVEVKPMATPIVSHKTTVRHAVPVSRPSYTCTRPHGKNVASAFVHARNELSNAECKGRYHEYFASLIEISSGDPGRHQGANFESFIDWSITQGLLNMREAKDLYTRYFGIKYISLQNDFSSCSSTCRVKDKTFVDMQEELVDKEKGLLQVLGNKTAYAKANHLNGALRTILDATCDTCMIAKTEYKFTQF